MRFVRRGIHFRGIAIFAAGVLATAVLAPSAAGQREDNDKVTGGGQVILSTASGFDAAGDTISFFAEATTQGEPGTTARGEVEYVPTGNEDGEEVASDRWHGHVSCLEVESDSDAIFAGTATNADGSEEPFEIRVRDNGEDGTDTILLRKPAENADCSDEDENGTSLVLGRGNLTVHNGPN